MRLNVKWCKSVNENLKNKHKFIAFAMSLCYLCKSLLWIIMLSRAVKESDIKALRHYLEQSEKIVITCHVSPDGDAIGSSLALWHVLSSIGKTVHIVTPDLPPRSLMFLSGAKDILPFTKYAEFGKQLFNEADLVICLDFNDIKRVDKMASTLAASPAPKVMIDHHLCPGDFANLVISHPEMSSTCVLLFRVLCRLELFNKINRKAAECIYTGMMTDTGNFTYNSNDPDLYVVISELVKKGINKDKLYQLVCNTNSAGRLRLNGYAVYRKMQLFPEHQAAMITLTRDELKEFDYEKGDTESLVNVPLSVPDITYSVFFRDDGDYIKVSTRSKGDFAVNRICEKYFNGGGHKNAAGGEYYGTLEDAVSLFLSILDENDKYLPSKQIKKK